MRKAVSPVVLWLSLCSPALGQGLRQDPSPSGAGVPVQAVVTSPVDLQTVDGGTTRITSFEPLLELDTFRSVGGERQILLARRGPTGIRPVCWAPQRVLLESRRGDFLALRAFGGPYRKCYVLQTEGEALRVPLLTGPADDAAPVLGAGNAVKTISSFSFNYIYACFPPSGQPTHFLLGKDYCASVTKVTDVLLGWVPAKAVVPWDHRLGAEFDKTTFEKRRRAPAAGAPVGEPGGVIYEDHALARPLALESAMTLLPGSYMRWPIVGHRQVEGARVLEIGFLGAEEGGQKDQELIAALGQVDIALVVDASTSAVKRGLDRLRKELVAELLKGPDGRGLDLRYALVLYDDFLGHGGGGVVIRSPIHPLSTDFTARPQNITERLDELAKPGVARGGPDEYEAPFAAIGHALNLSWRPNAQKLIVVIGDTGDRDELNLTGQTPELQALRAQVKDDRLLGLPLRIDQVMKGAAERGVYISSLDLISEAMAEQAREYLRQVPGDQARQAVHEANEAFVRQMRLLAEKTGGQFRQIADTSGSVAAVYADFRARAARIEEAKRAGYGRFTSEGTPFEELVRRLSDEYGAEVVRLARAPVETFVKSTQRLFCRRGWVREKTPDGHSQVTQRVMLSSAEVNEILGHAGKIIDALRQASEAQSEEALRTFIGESVLGDKDLARQGMSLAEVQEMTFGLPARSPLMRVSLDELVRKADVREQLLARFEAFETTLSDLVQRRNQFKRGQPEGRLAWRAMADKDTLITWVPFDALP
jgi:hypothetical protein